MSETSEKLLKGFHKTVKIKIDGEELPFEIRKLSVLELANKTSLIGSMLSDNGKKLADMDNADAVECLAWAVETACVDPCFSKENEEGKLPLATLSTNALVELGMKIFEHSGLVIGMQEARKVGPFSEGASKEASSLPT